MGFAQKHISCDSACDVSCFPLVWNLVLHVLGITEHQVCWVIDAKKVGDYDHGLNGEESLDRDLHPI